MGIGLGEKDYVGDGHEWVKVYVRKSMNMSRICVEDIDYLRILINFALSIL